MKKLVLPTKKILFGTILLIAAVCTPVQEVLAMWSYTSAPVMVKMAQVIALVDVGEPRNEETKFNMALYHRKADAKVEKLIKGDLNGAASVSIIAGMTAANGTRLCVGDIDLKSGRHLVFLHKVENNFVAVNFNYGFLPIVDNKVMWYTDLSEDRKNLFKRAEKSVEAVLEDVHKLMAVTK